MEQEARLDYPVSAMCSEASGRHTTLLVLVQWSETTDCAIEWKKAEIVREDGMRMALLEVTLGSMFPLF